MGESELIGLIRSRDENGMTELLRRYGPLMRYIISPILTDERDRQECLSDAAMRAWDGIEKFDPDTLDSRKRDEDTTSLIAAIP